MSLGWDPPHDLVRQKTAAGVSCQEYLAMLAGVQRCLAPLGASQAAESRITE